MAAVPKSNIEDERTTASSFVNRQPNNQFRLATYEQLVFKIRITCYDDKALLRQCGVSTLASLQDEVVESFKRHIDRNIYVRLSFHQGSLIVLVLITAASVLVLNSAAFQLIKVDMVNIARKVFAKLSNVNVEVVFKTVERAVDILADIVSIVAKLFIIFGGAGLPPVPPTMSSDGWLTV